MKQISLPSRKKWINILLKSLNLFLLTTFLSFKVEAREIILKVYVNTEDKGAYFLNLSEKDILIKSEDFFSFGFKKEEIGKIEEQEIGGVKYISLSSLLKKNVKFELIEKEASLSITAPSHLFGKKTISLSPKKTYDSEYQINNFLLFNYFLNYGKIHNSFESSSFNAKGEAIFRIYQLLLRSNFSYRYSQEPFQRPQEKFSRLNSEAIIDLKKPMMRIILGDYYAPNGVLIGGLNISRNFSLKPYFQKTSFPSLPVTIHTPSRIALYADKRLVEEMDLPPGNFEILDVPVNTGRGSIMLITKDAYGQLSKVKVPFYYAPSLLRPGVSDYNYSMGLKRENFVKNNSDYKDLLFSASHRFGLLKTLTLGAMVTIEDKYLNLGPQFTYLLPLSGIIKGEFAYSKAKKYKKEGYSVLVNYSYQENKIGGGLNLRYQTEDYLNSSYNDTTLSKSRLYGEVNLWLLLGKFGFINTSASFDDKYNREAAAKTSLIYTISRGGKSLNLTLNRLDKLKNYKVTDTENKVSLGLFFSLGRGMLSNYNSNYDLSEKNFSHKKDRFSDNFYFQKSSFSKKGFDYNFKVRNIAYNAYEKKEPSNINASLGYKGARGIYSLRYNFDKLSQEISQEHYDFSMEGALSFMRGSFFCLSRPIRDSFALVETPGIKGATVYSSGQKIGKTNRKGKLLIPELISNYDNGISVGMEGQELPLECSLKESKKYVSMPYGGAAKVNFEITKMQAYTGKVFILEDKKKIPVELSYLYIKYKDKEIEVLVGRGGEYYLENITPGKYPTSIFYEKKEYHFDLLLPYSEDVVVDLGELCLTSHNLKW